MTGDGGSNSAILALAKPNGHNDNAGLARRPLMHTAGPMSQYFPRLGAVLALPLLVPFATAQNFTVTSLTDTGTGSGNSGDLRYCITQANAYNATPSATSITFQAGLSGDIDLTSALPIVTQSRGMSINGAGASITIDGGSGGNSTGDRAFFFGVSSGESNATLTATTITTFSVSNLTIQNANARGGAGGEGGSAGGGGAGFGGALFVNAGTVTMQNVTFNGNRAVGGSGGVGGFSGGGAGGGMGGNGAPGGSSSAGGGGGGFGVGANGGAASQSSGNPGTAGSLGTFTGGNGGQAGSGTTGGAGGANGGGGGGSNGGSFTDGGGGGVNGSFPNGGFGGGGGGGGSTAGVGGFGGGGGAGGAAGGFGGGGGGQGGIGSFGAAGFGGGTGGSSTSATGDGGGGMGAGGAAFIRSNTSLNLIDPVFTGTNQAIGGSASGSAGSGQAIGQGLFLGGNLTITLSAGNTVTLGGSDFLGGGANAQAQGSFAKAGPGTLILAGSNSYTGGTTISAGTLRGNVTSFGTGAIADDASLVFNQPTSATFSQPISGSGAVTLQGGGILTLTGSNSYSGVTTINAGTLQIGAGGTAGAVGSGSIVDNGILTYNLTTSETLTNAISGTGGITKLVATALTLSGMNSYTGPTVVIAGSLIAASSSAFGATSAVTISQGTILTINGNNIAIGSLAGNGGTVNNNSTVPATLTIGTDNTSTAFAGLIADGTGYPLAVAKVGTGTLTLTGQLTNTGGYNVTGGTLEFSGALVQPGPSSLTAAAGATIQYDSGALVFSGFLYGPGTHVVNGATFSGTTAFNSAVINVTGAGSFVSFTNGGTLTVSAAASTPATFNGFTNQGSGSITVVAGSTVNAANFETYGMLTLTPNTAAAPTILTNTGTSALYFNGGSQMFIGTPQTADPTGQNIVDYIDLHGNNAIVAGGLLVNNGGIFDTAGAGTGTIIAEFGALVKGAGFYQNTVKTQNGGKFQTGNSPGSATFGNFVFGPGGVSNYIFAIDDATGVAGPNPGSSGLVSGWGLIKAVQAAIGSGTTSGNFTWTATPSNPLTVAIDTLVNPTTVGTDVAGPMADFDPTQSYSWTAAHWSGAYFGPTDAATLDADTTFDTNGFANPVAGSFSWTLDTSDQTLSLVYTPTSVPEPGTLALVGLAAAGACIRRRRARRVR